MSYTQIVNDTPIVTPAKDEIVYDRYWLSRFKIEANDPIKPISAVAVFVPARDVTVTIDEKEVTYKELMPNAIGKRLVIDDLFGEAAKDANMAKVINDVINMLIAKAQEKNVI
jgi:hypothetical protein